MSKDKQQPHEQLNANEVHYDNPIPSRDHLLDVIRASSTPLNRDDIFALLGLTLDEEYEGLRRRLRAMERDGQLVFTRRQCYALPERMDLAKGTVIGHRDGFGFFRVEGAGFKDDWLLPHHQMKTLLHGDVILAQLAGTDKRGRKEARLVRVVEPKEGTIVGRYVLENGISYVTPDDSRIGHEIEIPKQARKGARMGNVVVVKITERPTRHHQPVGKIVEILGENMAPGMEIEIALRSHDIPHEWPKAVEKQIRKYTDEVPEKAKEGRIDLRALPLVTIDGEDARDFDDAVYCEKKRGGGWRLWVAIADVSYYVRPETALDQEAIKRGNSVYFPAQVIPMLPEILSNGLCSLNPQVDRLCMVCEMTVSATGKLSGYKHYEAVMNSHARLTYNKVASILEGDEKLRERYAPLVPHLESLNEMYHALRGSREQRGAVEFETVETKFVFNALRKIDRIVPLERNDAHKIIEECMILANIASARFVEKLNEPALFRVHEAPGEERLTGFKDFLSEFGLTLEGGLKPAPTDYAALARKLKDRPDKELIQTMLLRSMKQAVYQAENNGHFGLALKQYAHFTSPIRRYPDLLLHRAIKYLIAKEQGNTERWTHTGGYHYLIDEMDKFGEQCSMTERRADDATRDVSDWLKCEYMQDHVGATMEGTIANVTGFGFFVRLNELHIDGLVHISNLDNDYYQFDMVGQKLVGESSGRVFRLGDQVSVTVSSVNLDERMIDFVLEGTSRKIRGAGKTARQKAKKSSLQNSKKEPNGKTAGGKSTSARASNKKGAKAHSKSRSKESDKANNNLSVRQQLKQGVIPKGAQLAEDTKGKGRKKKPKNKSKAKGSESTSVKNATSAKSSLKSGSKDKAAPKARHKKRSSKNNTPRAGKKEVTKNE